jgi:S-adenosylmethionine hydrolase
MKFVTLLTDFGFTEGYVAQMKGVILQTCPEAVIIDISHAIERHNIQMGSFILETSVPFFPKGTIHVAIVDPKVGSNRKAIVVKCANGWLVGPDNGLLDRTSRRLTIESIYWINEDKIQRKTISNTFHGRDIFANIAGLLASGTKAEKLGPRISKMEALRLPQPKRFDRKLACHVLHVDAFGNVITNVDAEIIREIPMTFGEHVRIQTGTRRLLGKFARSYSDVEEGELAVLMGSQGFLEVAVREGSARDKLDAQPLDKLELEF